MEKDREIDKLLKKYTVEVPDFPMKKSKMEKLANWLCEKASFPIPEEQITFKGMVCIQVIPIVVSLAVSVWMIL
ncbi:hypothetical protein Q4O60_00470 [Aeribacillus pallidus]|nr:hypothetical protein [Aeribacillus pallidus]